MTWMLKGVTTSDVTKSFSRFKFKTYAVLLLNLFSSHIDTANSISTPAQSQTLQRVTDSVQRWNACFVRQKTKNQTCPSWFSFGIPNRYRGGIANTSWISISNLRMRISTCSTCDAQFNMLKLCTSGCWCTNALAQLLLEFVNAFNFDTFNKYVRSFDSSLSLY